ncbi:KR domain-containing protein [Catenulispora yoronensis]
MRTVYFGRDAFRLRPLPPGDLASVRPAVGRRRLPGPGQVEIRVRAAGLHYRDVLAALDLLGSASATASGIGNGTGTSTSTPATYEPPMLGLECSGVVERVGPGVPGLTRGTEVVALGTGALGSFLTTDAELVLARPEGVTLAAAGLPMAYATAWHALVDRARLHAGQRVLIHCATGGIGLAAVHVARLLGAEVLATAGSEDKRRRLREMGIAHVFDSRSVAFAGAVREVTGGAGVDVLLNALPGAGLEAGLEALAHEGHFVEIGNRDILADARIGLAPFRRSISFAAVDMVELLRTRPARLGEVLRSVFAELNAGRLPVLPYTAYPFDHGVRALRTMARAAHFGKVVLELPEEDRIRAVLPFGPDTVVRPGGAYIVTGGLGRLGSAFARWLLDRGAGRVVVNGRSWTPAVDELPSGAVAVFGDIADEGVAEHLVAAATRDGLRLCGVLHAAAVRDGGPLRTVGAEQVRRVWRPKVAGAWRLHEALANQTPDWFVLFSSATAMTGAAGEVATATAAAWLDAFAEWRRARGLTALSVNWGTWSDAGPGSAAGAAEGIGTAEGIAVLADLIAQGRGRAVYFGGTVEERTGKAAYRPVFGLFHTWPDKDAASARQVAEHPRDLRSRVATVIRDTVGLAPGTPIDADAPLPAVGVDSLLALQLRKALERDLGLHLSASFVVRHRTLAALTVELAELIGQSDRAGDRAADSAADRARNPAHGAADVA